MNKYFKYILILSLALMASLCVNVLQYTDNRNTNTVYVEKTDTVVKIDSIVIYEPEPYTVLKTETKFEKVPVYLKDTIFVNNDSAIAEITYETKCYKEDSLYSLQITGHNSTLDWIKVFPKTEIINREKIITNTKYNHFNFTLGIGAGYGFFNKKPDVFVGGMIGYSF